jgi:hypothetical protein
VTRIALLVILVFVVLGILRALRLFLGQLRVGAPRREVPRRPAAEGEMVRDPVCGTWIDRRLALPVRQGRDTVSVCSEECRRLLEAG